MQNKEQSLPNKVGQTKIVRQSTMSSLVLFHNALVKPLKFPENISIDNLCYGEVVKLPADSATNRFQDGEEWKRLIKDKADSGFKVGDRVLYDSKTNVVICGKNFHLVSYFLGKINDEQNNN